MNINIRGKSSDFDFVLKLPWTTDTYDSNPYKQLHNIQIQFARMNIAPHPIEFGRLKDSSETPYYLIEYIDGTSYSDITEVPEDEILSLHESLRILKKQKLSGIPRYETPSDYLIANHKLVEDHIWSKKASIKVQTLIEEYRSLFPKVESTTDIIGYWSGDVMHGDLWIPNIIFRNSMESLILDFDMCAYGDSRYDLCRLLGDEAIDAVPQFISDEDVNFVNSLRPLVLAYIIDWSLERLLSMESGIVESNLNTNEIRSAILGYTKDRISRLAFLLAK
jgi:aminoglycoside phosphotransferase (APT) family kinase protein